MANTNLIPFDKNDNLFPQIVVNLRAECEYLESLRPDLAGLSTHDWVSEVLIALVEATKHSQMTSRKTRQAKFEDSMLRVAALATHAIQTSQLNDGTD